MSSAYTRPMAHKPFIYIIKIYQWNTFAACALSVMYSITFLFWWRCRKFGSELQTLFTLALGWRDGSLKVRPSSRINRVGLSLLINICRVVVFVNEYNGKYYNRRRITTHATIRIEKAYILIRFG